MEEKLNDQQLVRRQKMQDLKDKGIDPFGHAYKVESHSQGLKDKYSENTKEELEEKNIITSVAGRIMSKRRMGKLGFMHIQDKEGMIQIVVNKAIVGDDVYEIFKAADIGDIIGIRGQVVKTDSGELSIKASEYTHLAKALRPLPEKYHGFKDVEERYRRRYVDLIMNEDAKRIAFLRPKVIRAVQRYLDGLGLVEVETPVLQATNGGAAARPFITHHNALNRDFYLRIATELPLKRLIVGGMEGVYEIGRLFRNEGMDTKHNPEFTTVEAYIAYSDMYGMMELAEGLFTYVLKETIRKNTVLVDGKEIEIKAPFKRVNMTDAVNEKTNKDFRNITLEEAVEVAQSNGVELEKHEMTIGHIIAKLFDELCEEDMIEPTFVYGHPLEISPLAKKNSEDPRFTDRFEIYINGTEYGNSFSELNDPIDQRERFEEQLKLKALGDAEAGDMDTDYVEALEYGLPPTGGIGIGIDRLVMLVAEVDSIREVLLFPHMKDRNTKQTDTVEKKELKTDFDKVEVEDLNTLMIDYDEFAKSDYRVVKVKDCKAVEKSKKLLAFTLDDGSGHDRTILSGIHDYYEPEELIGKTLLAITNLAPRKMMGIDSCGMLISAIHHEEGEERLHLIMLDDDIPAGAKLY